jgi:hypothetical protein
MFLAPERTLLEGPISKLPWHLPVVREHTIVEALAEGLIDQADVLAMRRNGPPPNDPLAGMTAKQIFVDCIWISDESAITKLVLLCISRFFNADAKASSMAYSQVEADCSLGERTVKGEVAALESDDTAPEARKRAIRKAAQAARERWLLIERGKGFKTGSGPQNLYHGIVPARWLNELRAGRSRGVRVVWRDNSDENAHLDCRRPRVEPDKGIEGAAAAADVVAATVEGVHQEHPYSYYS